MLGKPLSGALLLTPIETPFRVVRKLYVIRRIGIHEVVVSKLDFFEV